jgi:hypothetical protein
MKSLLLYIAIHLKFLVNFFFVEAKDYLVFAAHALCQQKCLISEICTKI